MKNSTKWQFIALSAVALLVVALLPTVLGDDEKTRADQGSPAVASGGRPTGAQQTVSARLNDAALAAVRERAALQPCRPPAGGGTSPEGPLAAVVLDCLGAPGQVALADVFAGRVTLVNIWAHWCGPCREELPLLQRYSERAGDKVRVVTVHANPESAGALGLLERLGVHLPTVYDPQNTVATRAELGPAIPMTIVLDARGNVVGRHPGVLTRLDDIAAVVRDATGIDT